MGTVTGYFRERPVGIMFLACLCLVLLAPRLCTAELPPKLASFLKEQLGLSGKDLEAVERGKAVVRLIDAADEREVAMAGAVRFDVPVDFIARSYRGTLASLERSGLKGLGIFSTPAVLGDVADLSFPAGDLEDLEKCQTGDCKIKIYAEDIGKIEKRIDWKGDNAQGQVDTVFREDVVALVEDYRERGDAAIPDYVDKEQLMHAAKGFDFLLQESPLLIEYLPDFFGFIRNYPQETPESVDHFIFWTLEAPGSGLKETVFLTHAFLYLSATKDGLPMVSIAHKKLYASHYYHAALRSATVIDYSKGREPHSYMILLDRNLFDGKLGSFKRKMLRNGLRDGVEKELTHIRRRAGEAFRAASGG